MNDIRQASPWHYQTAPTGSSSSLVSPPGTAGRGGTMGASDRGHGFFYAIIFCISLCISSMRPFCAGSSIMSFMAAM